ncbi:SDR family NAD(P)-dependent oxidoreductase, partial [Streptomyces sp. NPDC059255]|uniref:SDR family NAD(P)-dependent oxidoreductase n=1 Tax=Streptomyces sp. NPDC059255 TaxID=3346793 RepID=UPI003688C458
MAGLQDKVVIVTGGARGIGAATAARMAREGAKTVITDLLDEQDTKTAAQIGGMFLHHDATSEDDVVGDLVRVAHAAAGEDPVLDAFLAPGPDRFPGPAEPVPFFRSWVGDGTPCTLSGVGFPIPARRTGRARWPS